MGIAEIIADVMAGDPHEVREEPGTGIKTALVKPENSIPDRNDGTIVFMPAEYE
jgi:hypothetical protein